MFAGDSVHHARHAFDFHGPPAFAMPVVPPAVAVPPPSTTPSVAAASEPTSSTAATDAVLLYPTGQPTINCIDNVQVAYNSAWENANLTISCETDQELQEWSMAEFGLRRKNHRNKARSRKADQISQFSQVVHAPSRQSRRECKSLASLFPAP